MYTRENHLPASFVQTANSQNQNVSTNLHERPSYAEVANKIVKNQNPTGTQYFVQAVV